MPHLILPALPSTQAALSLLETLLNRSYDAVLVTDSTADPKIIYANAAFATLTGYGTQELLGKSPRVLQGPSTDQKETARLGHLLREGKSFEGQAVNYRKDGTPFMMSWRVEPVSVNEEIVAWLAIQREVAMQWQPD
jgi:PAS domain S-box-containing protein